MRARDARRLTLTAVLSTFASMGFGPSGPGATVTKEQLAHS
jgi:hypothetical protein